MALEDIKTMSPTKMAQTCTHCVKNLDDKLLKSNLLAQVHAMFTYRRRMMSSKVVIAGEVICIDTKEIMQQCATVEHYVNFGGSLKFYLSLISYTVQSQPSALDHCSSSVESCLLGFLSLSVFFGAAI